MALRRTRTTGRPTSSNGASSFHLWWSPPPPAGAAVSVGLEVLEPPRTDDLVFWALQVSFDDGGRIVGGGHVGLQWHRGHPDRTAVNWGGYSTDGGELDGTTSSLPSATGNPNTRDFAWRPRVRYVLTVEPGRGPGWWRATVTDDSTGETRPVRELRGGGDRLVRPVVWSEVFAPCDAASTSVRWSRPTVHESNGGTWTPSSYRVTYQTVGQGGCSNTDVEIDEIGVIQRTSTPRRTRPESLVPTP